MKKKIILILVIASALVLSGCSILLPLDTTDFSTNTNTSEEITIDYDQLHDDVYDSVYNRIYSDLYNEIKSQIAEDISQEELELIYQNIRDDILSKIESGDIEIQALTVFDRMTYLALTTAKAVVGVNNLNLNGEINSTGSGVIYKKDGNQYYIITNEHVVKDAVSVEVQFGDGTLISAEVLGVEKLVDIAVLRFISEESFQTAEFGDSSGVQKGEFITAVGNPSGFDYFNTMTFGIISGINRYFDIDEDGTRDMFVNYLQHDAAINAGNSGGALFNLEGEIIGINTLKIVDYSIEGMGFAIPSNLVELIAGDIELYGESKRKPMLGITFIDIYQNKDVINAEEQIIPENINQGFYIQSVVSGSSVDGYVLAGDIVTQIGNVVIESTSQFVEEFSQYLVGDTIDIVVYRNGQYITLTDIVLKGRE